MRSRIMLMTLAMALGMLPSHLLSQTNAGATQDKMSNDKGGSHMAGDDKMAQDKMNGDYHMSGSGKMSQNKKHKKDKKSDSMSNGSH